MLKNHGCAIRAGVREVDKSVTVLDRDPLTVALFKRVHLARVLRGVKETFPISITVISQLSQV